MADESTRRAAENAATAAEQAAAAARNAADAVRQVLEEAGQRAGDGTEPDEAPEPASPPGQGGENSQPFAPVRGTDKESEYGTGQGGL